jgi:hypothetical protein
MKSPFRFVGVFVWSLALIPLFCVSKESGNTTPITILEYLDERYTGQGGSKDVFINSFDVLLERHNLTLTSRPVIQVFNLANFLEGDSSDSATTPIEVLLTEQFEAHSPSITDADCADVLFLVRRIDSSDLRAILSLISFPDPVYSEAATQHLLSIAAQSNASAVPAILDQLSSSTDLTAQLALVESLGEIGGGARDALPTLRSIMSSSDSFDLVRKAASSAIAQIEQDANPSLGSINELPRITNNEQGNNAVQSRASNGADLVDRSVSRSAASDLQRDSNGELYLGTILAYSTGDRARDMAATLEALRSQQTNSTPEQQRAATKQIAQIRANLLKDAGNPRSPTQVESANILQTQFDNSIPRDGIAFAVEASIDWEAVKITCPSSTTSNAPFTITLTIPSQAIRDPAAWNNYSLDVELSGDIKGADSPPKDLTGGRGASWSWIVSAARPAGTAGYTLTFSAKDRSPNSRGLLQFHRIDRQFKVNETPPSLQSAVPVLSPIVSNGLTCVSITIAILSLRIASRNKPPSPPTPNVPTERSVISEKLGIIVLFFTLLCVSSNAQIVVSNSDMFCNPGEGFRADYRETPDKDIGFSVNPSLFGTNGGPQSWNLDTLPYNDFYRFEYQGISQGEALSFPLANLVEERTVESSQTRLSKYLKQSAGLGRLSVGFVQENVLGGTDSVSYGKPLLEIPDPLHFGDTWAAQVLFTNIFNGVTMVTHYTSADKVDAFGTLSIPNLGVEPCLRINEIGTWNVQAVVGDQIIDFGTDYVRSYMWVVKGFGIAAQISSQGSPTVPATNFDSAFFIYRMFSTTRSGTINVRSVSLKRSNVALNLTWKPVSGASTYTVLCCTNFSANTRWQVLAATTGTNWTDSMNASTKLYLVNWAP